MSFVYNPSISLVIGFGFLQRLKNLENENGHGKVMEHTKLAKSHGILPI